jgi:uncharacterized membrane protein YczE
MFGSGIGLLVRANLGLAPWDVFHQGLSEHINLPIGRTIVITSFFVLLLWIPLSQPMGVGTLLNAVQIGVSVELVMRFLPEPDGLVVRSALMLLGILITAIGSGLYIGAGLGPGPRDGLMMGLGLKGYKISRARTLIEVTVLILGWLLGGQIGVGTVLFAVAIGPLVARFLPLLEMPSSDTTRT